MDLGPDSHQVREPWDQFVRVHRPPWKEDEHWKGIHRFERRVYQLPNGNAALDVDPDLNEFLDVSLRCHSISHRLLSSTIRE